MKRLRIYVPLVVVIGSVGGYFAWRPSYLRRQEAKRERAAEERYFGASYRDRDGRKEAEADIDRGRPKYKEHGNHAGQTIQWRAILRVRFGIEAEAIADCVVSKALVDYADAYNATIETYIAEKYGRDAFRAAREEAKCSPQPYQKGANQPPLQTPASGTPTAGAPVAPPSGAAGR